MLQSAFKDKPLCVPRQLAELLQLSVEVRRREWRNAPALTAVCFLAFDRHCYMYRAVKRVLERQAAYRGEARQTLPSIQEWRRFDAADVPPGLFSSAARAPAAG